MEAEHAPLAPSFAPVWGHCAGAVRAALAIPNPPTIETEEGTAAHWVASEYLQVWAEPRSGVPSLDFWLDETAPNGVVVDRDMLDAVSVYTNHIIAIAQEHGALQKMKIEHRVHMPHIHTDNWGTLDFALWLPEKALLILRDFKYGHRFCDPVGNLQMVDYIAGMFAELNLTGIDDQRITVDIGIVQPRCYGRAGGPVHSWTVIMSDLRAYWNILTSKATEALSANPTLSSGPHCIDCPAKLQCRASRLSNYSLFDYVQMPYEISDMGPSELAYEREIIEAGVALAAKRLEAVEAELLHRIAHGKGAGCGLTIEAKPGNVKWDKPAREVITVAKQFGVNAAKDDVITPKQFLSKVPTALKPAAEQTIKRLVKRGSSLQLTPIENSRTARAFSTPTE